MHERDRRAARRSWDLPAEVPADFGFSSEHPEIFLEARGAVLPRVVTIWCVASGEKLYVWGDPDSGWTRRVASRPDVRVRIGDGAYELTATEVTDADEREWVVAAYAAKYGTRRSTARTWRPSSNAPPRSTTSSSSIA
jgi:hypothetical protein